MSEELEYQSQDEHIQFRANKEHPVILGDMLNRIFDIMKKDLRVMYAIYVRSCG